MSECNDCGRERLTKDCEYCGVTYCTDHILPERHKCPGLDNLDEFQRAKSEAEQIGDEDDDDAESTDVQESTETQTKAQPELSDPSPDVNPDGSIAGDKSDSEADTVNTFRRAFTGVRESAKYHGDCPYCGTYLNRTGQTGPIRTCDDCGWEPGLPVLRTVTHWPDWGRYKRLSKQLFSTAFRVSVVALFIIAAAWLVTVGPLSSLDTSNITSADVNTSAVSGSGQIDNGDGFDRLAAEKAIHDEVNQRRQEHGVRKVGWDQSLQFIARDHSEDMIKRGFFSHENPDGDGLADRYDEAGYNCRVDAGVGHSAGGENIAQSWWETNIKQNGTISNYGTVDELAKGIVDQWMNSQGHRENLLNEYWQQEGIGVALREDGAVFVTQDFC